MPQLTLTPKSSSYGTLSGLPVSNVSTVCTSVNPAYYTAAVGTISPTVLEGQLMIVKVTVQCAVGATVRTLRITNTAGTVVLIQFPSANCIADPTASVVIFSSRVIIDNIADWVDVKLQVSSNVALDTVQINASSLLIAFAESCNAVDESFIKRNVSNLYFISMQSVQESVLGKIGSPTGTSFITVPINGLSSGFVWSTNSGNSLYSWEGSSIGMV
jgi:hypothetical protein